MGERVADEGHPLQDHERSDVARGESDEDPCDETVYGRFCHRNPRAPKSGLCSARPEPLPKISINRSGSERRLVAPKNRAGRFRAKTAAEYREAMGVAGGIGKTGSVGGWSSRVRAA